MEFKKIYLTVSVIALTCSQYAVASPLDNISHTHTQHTLELKPISNSFQIAAATFLPDKGEDLGFNGRELNDNHGNTPQIDLCSKFPLSACPANAKCSKCPTGNKFKLSGCNDGFKLSAGTCVALNCPEINPAYRADVPVNQVCSTISASGKTCYQTCKAIDFSGYPVTSCPANATCADHPDCATTSTKKGNCSPIKKKVTTCTLPSQKLNANASGCVNKDDTCPSTYFKTCETGTTGTARYTELGSACYQCKPACAPLPSDNISSCTMGYKTVSDGCEGTRNVCDRCEMGTILYSDRSLSNDYISTKIPIGIVVDCDKKYAMALQQESFGTWEQTGGSYVDIPTLKNCTKMEDCPNNGKENTKKIVDSYPISIVPPALHAYKYSPKGCSSFGSWCGAGNWYLPAVNQMPNVGLVPTFNKIPYQYKKVTYYGFVGSYSSNEYSADEIWHCGGYAEIKEHITKRTGHYSHPFIDF